MSIEVESRAECVVAGHAQTLRGRPRSEFVHDVERKEFAVSLLVEPSAFEFEDSNARGAAQSERVQGELLDRPIEPSIRLVIENVNCAVTNLQEVDVAGGHFGQLIRNGEARGAERSEVRRQDDDRNLDCNSYGIAEEHEALERIMARCSLGNTMTARRESFGADNFCRA